MRYLLRPRGWAMLVGVLLIQLGWILALPPFGGIDEHDHMLKAAAVARGDVSPHHEPSTQGWGEFVTVPDSIAKPGEPQCSILPYTHPDNCVGVENSDGTVRIASSAARYNPAYYAVVGVVTYVVTGDTALYVMRGVTALLCAIFITTALLVTRSWSSTPWPPMVLLLALTPTAVYSTAIVAPNGIEISAGLLLWTSLVGLRADARRRISPQKLLVVAGLASVPLLSVRTLGPVWWLLIVAGALITVGVPRMRELARLRAARLFVLFALLSGLYGLTWSVIARSNGFVREAPNPGSPWPDMFSQWLLWFFQTIAAAPLRNEYVPMTAYGIALTIMALTTLASFLAATPRVRWAFLYILAMASATGVGASAVSFAASGYAWQGRYFYPFTVGFFVIAGVAFESRPQRLHLSFRFVAFLMGATVATIQLISQVAVRNRGAATSPLAHNGHWNVPSTGLLIALTLTGTVLLVAGVLREKNTVYQPRDAEHRLLATR